MQVPWLTLYDDPDLSHPCQPELTEQINPQLYILVRVVSQKERISEGLQREHIDPRITGDRLLQGRGHGEGADSIQYVIAIRTTEARYVRSVIS